MSVPDGSIPENNAGDPLDMSDGGGNSSEGGELPLGPVSSRTQGTPPGDICAHRKREDELEEEDAQDFDIPLTFRMGVAWADGKRGSVGKIPPSDRAHEAMIRMLDRGEMQRALMQWRLNAARRKGATLAMWAVDQGNRKAYEIERALMAENSWATTSIIWEGYSRSPLVGLTESAWFWSSVESARDEASARRVGEALKVSYQKNSLLDIQIEAARRQLTEWQEIADFQTVEDGSWKSMKIATLNRQVAMLRKELEGHKQMPSHGQVATHSFSNNKGLRDASHEGDNSADGSQGAAGANAEDTDECSPPGMQAPSPPSRAGANSSLPAVAVSSDLRNWMMGYTSQRQIFSTIPGLSTHADVRGCESLGGGAHCNSIGPVDNVCLEASLGSGNDTGGGEGGGGEGGGAEGGGAEGQLELSTEDVLMNHASADNLSLRAFEQGCITAATLVSRRQKQYAELRLVARALDRRARDAMLKLDAAVQGEREAQERLKAVEAAARCEGEDIGEGGLFCRAEEEGVLHRVEELEAENGMLKFLLKEYEEQLENARADMSSVEFVM